MGNVFLSFDNNIFHEKIAEYSPYSLPDILELAQKHQEINREFDKGDIAPDKFYRQVTELLKVKVSAPEFFKLYNDIFSLRQKELNILKRLRLHYKLVLLSNTDVQRYGFILETFPQIKIFDGYVLSYQVGCIKPDPHIYEYALIQAGSSPRECIFIDDLKENIAGAKLVGINTIHFTPETDLATELQKYQLQY